MGILKSYFWKASFSFINSSQNRWYLARSTQNRKIPKFARACSCSASACSCLPVNGHARARAHSPKSRFWSVSVPFINSAQNRWYLDRNAQNWKIWKSGILGILNSYFWKVSFSFINSSQNRWYLARNAQNRKIPKFARACSCLLVLSLCLLASQCGLTVLRSAVPETDWDHKVNCTYCMPEENYMDHIALSKLDFSGLWVWTPN